MFVLFWGGFSSASNLSLIARSYVEHKISGSPQKYESPGFHTSNVKLGTSCFHPTTTILNLGHWISYLSGNKADRPREILFEYLRPRKKGQAQLPEKSIGKMNEARFFVAQSTCQAIGFAYERNLGLIQSKWGDEFRSWPVEIQFFRHCRNACFHGNSFNIIAARKRPAIDPNAPPKWKSLVISDASINGTRFACNFFQYQHTLPFLADIGNMLSKP